MATSGLQDAQKEEEKSIRFTLLRVSRAFNVMYLCGSIMPQKQCAITRGPAGIPSGVRMRVRKRLGGSPWRVMTCHIHRGLCRFQVTICGEDREEAKLGFHVVWNFWGRGSTS